MKNTLCMSLVVLLAGLGSAESRAQENGFYLGSGVGNVALDLDGKTFTVNGAPATGRTLGLDFERIPTIAMMGGYNWGNWALELEFERSLSDADIEIGRVNVKGDFSYSNFKVQGAYRSAGDLYFLSKLGWNVPDLDANLPGGGRIRLGQSGFVTVGGGFRFTPSTAVELEYDFDSNDTRTVSLGLWHRF